MTMMANFQAMYAWGVGAHSHSLSVLLNHLLACLLALSNQMKLLLVSIL